jgi:hypothetical protein
VARENKILADHSKTDGAGFAYVRSSTWFWYLLSGPPRKRGGFVLPFELMSDSRPVRLMMALTLISLLLTAGVFVMLLLR